MARRRIARAPLCQFVPDRIGQATTIADGHFPDRRPSVPYVSAPTGRCRHAAATALVGAGTWVAGLLRGSAAGQQEVLSTDIAGQRAGKVFDSVGDVSESAGALHRIELLDEFLSRWAQAVR